MKFLLFIIVIVTQVSCSSLNSPYNNSYARSNRAYDYNSPPPARGMPSGPGCYARCLMPDQYESYTIPIVEYTGVKYNDPNVKPKRIIVEEASSKWEKKKADKDCQSRNPDDCLVWCLVENEKEVYDYYTVIDTALNKEFIIKQVEYKELITPGGYTEWKQVVCDVQVSTRMYRNLQAALIDFGYIPEIEKSDNPVFGPTIKAALVRFQKDRSLPIGHLDLETLDALGVDY